MQKGGALARACSFRRACDAAWGRGAAWVAAIERGRRSEKQVRTCKRAAPCRPPLPAHRLLAKSSLQRARGPRAGWSVQCPVEVAEWAAGVARRRLSPRATAAPAPLRAAASPPAAAGFASSARWRRAAQLRWRLPEGLHLRAAGSREAAGVRRHCCVPEQLASCWPRAQVHRGGRQRGAARLPAWIVGCSDTRRLALQQREKRYSHRTRRRREQAPRLVQPVGAAGGCTQRSVP